MSADQQNSATDAITAETRTTADGLQNTYFNNAAITANFEKLEQQQMVFKTQLFLIIRMQFQQKL
jgi:hypothetical protein